MKGVDLASAGGELDIPAAARSRTLRIACAPAGCVAESKNDRARVIAGGPGSDWR
jgi:hypothetical protein